MIVTSNCPRMNYQWGAVHARDAANTGVELQLGSTQS